MQKMRSVDVLAVDRFLQKRKWTKKKLAEEAEVNYQRLRDATSAKRISLNVFEAERICRASGGAITMGDLGYSGLTPTGMEQ